jgi:hypothetical protein
LHVNTLLNAKLANVLGGLSLYVYLLAPRPVLRDLVEVDGHALLVDERDLRRREDGVLLMAVRILEVRRLEISAGGGDGCER